MIATELLEGGGLGNQLFWFSTIRAIAKKTNQEYAILNRKKFKGQNFLEIDYGSDNEYFPYRYDEKKILNHYGKDVSPMDEEMFNVKDGTRLYGTMQSLRYFDGISRDEIQSWIRYKDGKQLLPIPNDICIIHIRGGDFRMAGNTLLTQKYYQDSMTFMQSKNPDMKFFVVTDDPIFAWSLLKIPIIGSSTVAEIDEFQASHHIGMKIDQDYKLLNSAQNVILSNSSFGFWPVFTSIYAKNVVAPAYWAAHNYDEPFWSTNDMRVENWNYIDKRGNIL